MPRPPSTSPITAPRIVGRTRELRTLTNALDDARSGSGSFVIVAGDAGVGKSRILAEVARQARGQRVLVMQGSCFEQDSAFPYAPVVDALRAQFSKRGPAELENLLGPVPGELVKLVPEISLVLPEIRPTPALDPESEKRRLFESIARFLIQLSQRQPILFILEDLHWSDDSSLELLHLLARRLASQQVMLLASYRTEEAPPSLTHLLVQLARERLVNEVPLAPFTRAEVESVLAQILDPPGPVSGEFVGLLHELTEGNAFAVEEVLAAVIDAGELESVAGRWQQRTPSALHVPRSVRIAVQRRTSKLEAREREPLTLAAVAGRRFELNTLREATSLDEAELLAVIKRLIAAQIVVEESSDRFAFRHALTREAIYTMLLKRERPALHRRVARALERAHAHELDRYAADLGYHYHAAESWENALTHARRAGEQALALNSPRAAIEHLNRALDAAERLSREPPVDLLRARARAYETTGYFEAAREDLERAIGAARQAHDRSGEWLGLIALGRLWASRDYAQTGKYFEQALAKARELGDPRSEAVSLNRLGNWLANVEQPGQALGHHRAALELFEGLNDNQGVVETLDLIGMASQLGSELQQAHVAYSRAVEMWRTSGDQRGLAATLASVPLCAPIYFHQLEAPAIHLRAGVSAAEEAVRIAREIGWRAGESFGLFNLTMTLGPLGEYAGAFEAARSALECAEEIRHRQWITAAHSVTGMLLLDVLAFDDAVAALERALELARAMGSRVWTDTTIGLLARASLERGDVGRAAAVLKEALTPDTPTSTQAQRVCWHARAELALADGDAATALRIADRLAERDEPDSKPVPLLWKLRGSALAHEGRLDEAAETLEAARDVALQQGARPLLWRIQALLGRLYHKLGRREEARHELGAAAEMIRSLAAEMPDEALRDRFLQSAGAALPRVRAPSAGRAEKERFGGLSRRQRQVAFLIAQGWSNRDLADELGVGVRTIETHVTQILSKLGFSSRAQIAAWAVENGLSGTREQI